MVIISYPCMFSLVDRRFLSSPNFVGWFSVRKEEANQKLRLLHLDMLCKAVGDCDRPPTLLQQTQASKSISVLQMCSLIPRLVGRAWEQGYYRPCINSLSFSEGYEFLDAGERGSGDC